MTDAPRQAAPPPALPDGSPSARRFRRLVAAARLIVGWERLWPALWPPLGVAGAFIAIAWTGLWIGLPPLARMIGCGLFGLALLVSLMPLIRLARPKRSEALARLDRDALAGHRPASTLDDALALGAGDPAAQALWAEHQRRAAAGLAALRLSTPRTGIAARDRFALRGMVLVALVASAFIAGPEWAARLAAPFDWRGLELKQAGYRIDGWIDPPLYTRLPPVLLDLKDAFAERNVRVPVGSTMVIRAAGRAQTQISADPGLEAKAAPQEAAAGKNSTAKSETVKGDEALTERRFTVRRDGEVTVGVNGDIAARIHVAAIPDTPPAIRFTEQPQANARGSLTIAYDAKDDYGVASAKALVTRADGDPKARSLVPPPNVTLNLPLAGETAARTVADLSASPWAGARVRMVLVARDEAGQEGRSAPVTLTLPQRPFTKPLAKALVEQRRTLIVDPDQRKDVQTALDALLIAPEDFTPEPAIYLGLRIASEKLRAAKTDPQLIETADFLWQMALQIEDGDLSAAERNLRAAQEALRQAIARGADPKEIERLTRELRSAMNEFLNEMARRQQQNGGQRQMSRNGQTRMVTPDDLKRLLDRIEQLTKQGATADAQRLLDELRNILENLRTARPGQPRDMTAQEMNRTLNDLDSMIRDQQALRDDTFRDGQRRQQENPNRMDRGMQDGNRQQGQQGAPQELGQRQQALRGKLEELQRQMKNLGLQGEPGLDEAERAMREAEGKLGQGQSGEAVDPQGRALDGLRRGAEGMARQMAGEGQDGQQSAQNGDGQGQPGGTSPSGQYRTDPLGRPTRGREWLDGRVKIPDDSVIARARRILDELRKRISDPARSREELDYLERLLSPR